MTGKTGASGPVEKDHVQILQELLEEVRGLREHMGTVSKYVEGLNARIAAVLTDELPLHHESIEESIQIEAIRIAEAQKWTDRAQDTDTQ